MSDRERATAFICTGCGTQYPPGPEPPAHCTICEDEREFVGPGGQQWTTLAAMRGFHHNRFEQLEPGITLIVTEPAFAIGQQAYLVETEHGNVLWETLAYLDEATIAEIERRGGVEAISISHPHFYTTMGEWSRALGEVPIHQHADNRPWVMNPTPAIRFWTGESLPLLPGLTVVRCGGHFPGSSVLHWAGGADGKGLLLSGDTIMVASDRRWVSFMHSFPNLIPLDAASVHGITAAVEPYMFVRIYGGVPGQIMHADAKAAVRRSVDRYVAHLQGHESTPRTDATSLNVTGSRAADGD